MEKSSVGRRRLLGLDKTVLLGGVERKPERPALGWRPPFDSAGEA